MQRYKTGCCITKFFRLKLVKIFEGDIIEIIYINFKRIEGLLG